MNIVNTLPPAILFQGDVAIGSQTVTINQATHGILNILPGDRVVAAIKDDDTGGALGGIATQGFSGTDIVVTTVNATTNNDGQLAVTVVR